MTTIPSMRSSKTNWLSFHRRHCSSLIANCFKAIKIGDSIAAGLNRYRSVKKGQKTKYKIWKYTNQTAF